MQAYTPVQVYTHIVANPWGDPAGLPGVCYKQVSTGVDKRHHMDITVVITVQQV